MLVLIGVFESAINGFNRQLVGDVVRMRLSTAERAPEQAFGRLLNRSDRRVRVVACAVAVQSLDSVVAPEHALRKIRRRKDFALHVLRSR